MTTPAPTTASIAATALAMACPPATALAMACPPATALAMACPPATAGELAVLNLESALQRAWQVLARWPDRPGTAERIVDDELTRAQFLGDATALDRLVALSSSLCNHHPLAPTSHLVAAQVASMLHHFARAKSHLTTADTLGASPAATARVRLAVAQALGEDLPAVLAQRRAMAVASASLQDLVPLGALLADLGEFDEADQTYARAIRQYRDLSPFALAWACFQRGLLWGETVPQPDPVRAAAWYRQALDYLPAYTHARVHLAEIQLGAGDLAAAHALLAPVADSGDPEVPWRLAQVLAALGRVAEAATQLQAARRSFEALLRRHELAFADHAAAFYLEDGADPRRASQLALLNLANRPTRRAFALAHAAAVASGQPALAVALLARAPR